MKPTPPSPEHRAQDHEPEPAFDVWLEDVTRIAIEVKGGRYLVDGGTWVFDGPDGATPKASPLMQEWDNTRVISPDDGYSLRSAEDPEQGSPQNAPESP